MKSRSGIYHVLLTFLAILHMAPIVTIMINSLRSNQELEFNLIGIPTKLYFQNYVDTWVIGEYLIAYRNNVIIGFSTVLIVLVVNGLAAYGITKRNIYFKRFFLAYFFAVLSIPGFGIIVSVYFIFQRLGLVNTHSGIILIYSALEIPFSLLFMRAFFVGIPDHLEEAAQIDGCTPFRSLVHIILPLSKPIITTVALIVFVRTWNEFLFGNTFLHQPDVRTVSLRFYNFVGKYETDFAYIYSGGVISIFPIIILFLILQKSFISGMTQGAIKG